MLYGLYQSAQGAHVQARRLEVTAHNIANANTTAFKQDVAVVRSVPQFSDLFNEQFLDEFDERGLQNHKLTGKWLQGSPLLWVSKMVLMAA